MQTNNNNNNNQPEVNQQQSENSTNQSGNNNNSNLDQQNHYSTMTNIAHFIWVIAMIVSALLAVRFFLILFGANSINGFVNFIYTISYPFARPFFGMFSYKIQYGVSRVEIASLVGIVIYSLAAYLIAKLLTINTHPQTT